MGLLSRRPSDIGPGIPPDPAVVYSWWTRAWVALDQTANVFFLNGLPDETISSHAGRLLREGELKRPPRWARTVCWLCNYFQTDHCKGAIGH